MTEKVNSIDFLDKIVTVKMDRPIGTKHPKHGFIYPINYGYIPNTISGDGEELDAYIIGPTEPLDEFTGQCIAIIHSQRQDHLLRTARRASADVRPCLPPHFHGRLLRQPG